jgi:hypothetical protein
VLAATAQVSAPQTADGNRSSASPAPNGTSQEMSKKYVGK